ncbi:hypothetical protein P3T76_005857 [Phytophthora citrophthora]|uniref:Uncharacterized protein n=1 Tax=Phytophthora citrophthora TaxID=4793 RepID=A0AAD9GQC5_9STRA|nr:hypothetical protein P3T76_005857 [Phytophthora citrophthora]
MLDPKTSLAIDAPPVVPYDDGFSTDSEDLDEREHMLQDLASSLLSISASSASKDAAVIENQSIVQQQQIQVDSSLNDSKQKPAKKSQPIPPVTSKTLASTSNGAANSVQSPLNHAEKTKGDATAKENEENCKNCNGHLTPLGERLKVMKTAAQQKLGKGPPLCRQCCCCHITYPFVSLTYESRSRACTEPRCYKCNWASKASRTDDCTSTIGVKRAVNGEVKHSEESSKPSTPQAPDFKHKNGLKTNGSLASTKVNGDKATAENCCRNCRAQLPSLEERREVMKYYASMQIKDEAPPTRQCSCCFITYTLASLSSKNTEPFCFACNDRRARGLAAEEQIPSSSVADKTTKLKPEAKNPPDIIVIDDAEDDEEGELLEEETCKCCEGKLITMAKRVEMTKEASKKHGGKGLPPSRQCACCRITYPSAALTNKSRQLTRTVPICRNCCQAGGNIIYEMLCVSDEFIEGFRIENPEMARNLLKKKKKGTIDEAVKNHKQRMATKKLRAQTATTRPASKKKVEPSKQRLSAATGSSTCCCTTCSRNSVSGVVPAPVLLKPGRGVVKNTGRNCLGRPRYHLVTMMARKSAPAPRLVIGRPPNTPPVTPPARAETVVRAVDHQREALPVSYLDPPVARTARWLRQFEIVDGKTARERRLEGRQKDKED